MSQTHILVDFENVQPSADDIGFMRGEVKYAADLAEAWQPLGGNVTFIRCAKAGRNAVDMHIAFYLGELQAARLLPLLRRSAHGRNRRPSTRL